MAYNGDKTWADLVRELGTQGKTLLRCLRDSEHLYDDWLSFKDSRSNADIATALSRTEAEIAEMDAAFLALQKLFDYAANGTPTQKDYFADIMKFS